MKTSLAPLGRGKITLATQGIASLSLGLCSGGPLARFGKDASIQEIYFGNRNIESSGTLMRLQMD